MPDLSAYAWPFVDDPWDEIAAALAKSLPPPGIYPATVSKVHVGQSGDALWLSVRCTLDGLRAEPNGLRAVIATDGDTLDHARIGDGARLIASLAGATHTPLANCSNPFALPKMFERRRLRLRIAHSSRDGMKALVIRKIFQAEN
jgi:hypothetical protein